MKKNYNNYSIRKDRPVAEPELIAEETPVAEPIPATVEEKVVDIKHYKVVRCSNLNLRKNNNLSAEVLTVIPAGEVVEVVDHKNGWLKIIYEGTIGWSLGQYLEEVL